MLQDRSGFLSWYVDLVVTGNRWISGWSATGWFSLSESYGKPDLPDYQNLNKLPDGCFTDCGPTASMIEMSNLQLA